MCGAVLRVKKCCLTMHSSFFHFVVHCVVLGEQGIELSMNRFGTLMHGLPGGAF